MEHKDSPPLSPKKGKRSSRTESFAEPELHKSAPVNFLSLRSPKMRDKKVSVSKAIYHLVYKFDYFDRTQECYHKILKNWVEMSECHYAFIAEIKGDDNSQDMTIQDFQVDGFDKDNEQRPKVLKSLTNPNTIFGITRQTKTIVIANDPQRDPRPGHVIPQEHSYVPLQSFCSIPLFRPEKKESTKQLVAVVGLGNRKEGFSDELISTWKPMIKAAETLIEAFHCHRQLEALGTKAELQQMITKMKSEKGGIPLKDRKHHLKTYKQTFTGKEMVSWLIENGGKQGLKTKEEAIQFGNELMKDSVFFHINKELELQDDQTLYTFSEENTSAVITTPSKTQAAILLDDKSKRKSTSSFLLRGKSDTKEDNPVPSYLEKRDAAKLKKKLSHKKFLDQVAAYKDLNQRSALQIAIETDDADSAEVLIQAYVSHPEILDITAQDKNGYTPLHAAAEAGNERILMHLLQFPSIETNIPNKDKNTPFHCFCSRFSSPSSVNQLFQLFLQRGTDINAPNFYSETPLHKAILNPNIRAMLVRLLVDHGASVDVPTNMGETPLHYAIRLKRQDLVYILLAGSADPLLKGKDGSTAVDLAIETKDEEILFLINSSIALSNWLHQIDMKKYHHLFVKELLFNDVLAFVNDKMLIDMGVTLAGDRLRIMQAVNLLKKEQKKQGESVQQKMMKTEEKDIPIIVQTSPKDSPAEPPRAPPKEADPNSLQPNTAEQPKAEAKPARMRLGDLRRKKSVTYLVAKEKVTIPGSGGSSPLSTNSAYGTSEPPKVDTPTIENWIPWGDLEFTNMLGSGTSGDVYDGFYKGEHVAIKVLTKDSADAVGFKNEYKILNTIRGPNIVHFFGACIRPRPCLIMEFCSRGSLYDILNNKDIDITWSIVLRFSTEMAAAIFALHSHKPQVIHRDLKSMNFLVTEDWTIKVCDFGLSRFYTNTNMSTLFQLRGTMCYVAPETMEGKAFTTKSDIYSLGVILWELLYRCVTGEYQRPFSEYTYITQPLQIALQASQKGLRPNIPVIEKCPKLYVSLIQACWDPDTSKRPSAEAIQFALQQCQKDILENPGNWKLVDFMSNRKSSAKSLTDSDNSNSTYSNFNE